MYSFGCITRIVSLLLEDHFDKNIADILNVLLISATGKKANKKSY